MATALRQSNPFVPHRAAENSSFAFSPRYTSSDITWLSRRDRWEGWLPGQSVACSNPKEDAADWTGMREERRLPCSRAVPCPVPRAAERACGTGLRSSRKQPSNGWRRGQWAQLCFPPESPSLRSGLSAAGTQPRNLTRPEKSSACRIGDQHLAGTKPLPFHNLLVGKISDADFGADDQ